MEKALSTAMVKPSTIQALIADNSDAVIESLSAHLRRNKRIEVVASARIIIYTVYDLLMTRIIFLEAGANAVIQGTQLFERIADEVGRMFPE